MIAQRLEWDSNFFDLEVGKWEGCDEGSIDQSNFDTFQLLYQFSDTPCNISIAGFTESHAEVKVNFKKDKLASQKTAFGDIRSVMGLALDRKLLYNLAYESGKYSRFKLDPKISDERFKALYRLWIDNSITGQFSDGFLVKAIEDTPAGLVTYKFSQNKATIGLIAVSPRLQGKGIGSELLAAVEKYVFDAGMESLVIPTQKSNEMACKFYEINGYSLSESKHIKHFWRDPL